MPSGLTARGSRQALWPACLGQAGTYTEGWRQDQPALPRCSPEAHGPTRRAERQPEGAPAARPTGAARAAPLRDGRCKQPRLQATTSSENNPRNGRGASGHTLGLPSPVTRGGQPCGPGMAPRCPCCRAVGGG